ncbi:hypothetical protein Syun_025573 [Stephania yunnanensis]|uniref:Uncharacterized protein n=1 Tax=Stephania yunnanensis TaxID=152371 RepID=A0AAP0EZ25_9MAGN
MRSEDEGGGGGDWRWRWWDSGEGDAGGRRRLTMVDRGGGWRANSGDSGLENIRLIWCYVWDRSRDYSSSGETRSEASAPAQRQG